VMIGVERQAVVGVGGGELGQPGGEPIVPGGFEVLGGIGLLEGEFELHGVGSWMRVPTIMWVKCAIVLGKSAVSCCSCFISAE
jgi:hypothetical protein